MSEKKKGNWLEQWQHARRVSKAIKARKKELLAQEKNRWQVQLANERKDKPIKNKISKLLKAIEKFAKRYEKITGFLNTIGQLYSFDNVTVDGATHTVVVPKKSFGQSAKRMFPVTGGIRDFWHWPSGIPISIRTLGVTSSELNKIIGTNDPKLISHKLYRDQLKKSKFEKFFLKRNSTQKEILEIVDRLLAEQKAWEILMPVYEKEIMSLNRQLSTPMFQTGEEMPAGEVQ